MAEQEESKLPEDYVDYDRFGEFTTTDKCGKCGGPLRARSLTDFVCVDCPGKMPS